jgi:hypothetical protein
MTWQVSPESDEDQIAARDFIAADNEQSAPYSTWFQRSAF